MLISILNQYALFYNREKIGTTYWDSLLKNCHFDNIFHIIRNPYFAVSHSFTQYL